MQLADCITWEKQMFALNIDGVVFYFESDNVEIYEFDEDGVAYWFDDEEQVWYYFDEEYFDWIECEDDECEE
jgi:hypothetical protein